MTIADLPTSAHPAVAPCVTPTAVSPPVRSLIFELWVEDVQHDCRTIGLATAEVVGNDPALPSTYEGGSWMTYYVPPQVRADEIWKFELLGRSDNYRDAIELIHAHHQEVEHRHAALCGLLS